MSDLIAVHVRLEPRDPILRGAISKPIVREQTEAVYDAFEALEAVLEQELGRNSERGNLQAN